MRIAGNNATEFRFKLDKFIPHPSIEFSRVRCAPGVAKLPFFPVLCQARFDGIATFSRQIIWGQRRE
jgi:hypothetical protein